MGFLPIGVCVISLVSLFLLVRSLSQLRPIRSDIVRLMGTVRLRSVFIALLAGPLLVIGALVLIFLFHLEGSISPESIPCHAGVGTVDGGYHGIAQHDRDYTIGSTPGPHHPGRCRPFCTAGRIFNPARAICGSFSDRIHLYSINYGS